MVNVDSLANRPPRPQSNLATFSSDSRNQSAPPPPTMEPETHKDSGDNQAIGSKRSRLSLKKILLGLILVLVLAGLGYYFWQKQNFSSTIGSGTETTITYWGLWEPESVMAGLIEEFEKENPGIKVNYIQQSITDYRKRLQSALASGSGPDVFRIHNTWLPMFINDLSPVPSEVAASLELATDYYPVVKETLSRKGNFYAVPLMIDTLALFYNKDILAQYQIEPPQDWDQFRQVASQLTITNSEGQILQAGVAMGTTSNIDHWSDVLGLMMIQNGANITGPYDVDAQQALDFFMVFSRGDRVWDETLPESTRAFAGGKLALYFAPSWRIVSLNELNPDLNFGVVAAPQLPDKESIAWASFWAEGVSLRSQNQEAAWRLLEFLSRDESLERLFKAGSQVHYIGELYPKISMANKLTSDPLLLPFVEQAPYATSWYLSSRTGDSGINDSVIKYFEDAVNRSLLGADSELDTTVTQGVASVLSKYAAGSL